ncbi:unnamed protein product [Rangifer tarandus platyrhynchus]|uniref:Uncharacterized protein n=3 Tax=Rangifer tarandus platyrhynchus TaxID=3082113 RepID=A0ABN8Z7W2_RANTA|nr:unnamed protein product [Rangifer tarandus platyrhynchus]CAI9703978.1 unnamed protein product [Rangifer tarandus platyrhynchus]
MGGVRAAEVRASARVRERLGSGAARAVAREGPLRSGAHGSDTRARPGHLSRRLARLGPAASLSHTWCAGSLRGKTALLPHADPRRPGRGTSSGARAGHTAVASHWGRAACPSRDLILRTISLFSNE